MINSDKTLVAYLDILGYQEIIEKSTPEIAFETGNKIFSDYETLIKNIRPDTIETKEDIEKHCAAAIIDAIKFNILSDTIIVYLDYAKVVRVHSEYFAEIDHDYSAISLFFHMVSTFVLLFIMHAGYLIRGGITLGKFYKNSFDTKLLHGDLIFSEALVKSYLLEKSAIYPRVIIDDKLNDLWKSKISFARHQAIARTMIKKDPDGEHSIDFYEILRPHTPENKNVWLANIRKYIEEQLIERKNDKNVWRKWFWMKEYHNYKINQWVLELEQNLEGLKIN